MRLEGITVFPVKGLNGVPLTSATLAIGEGLPGDRRFALTTNRDLEHGEWRSSRAFLINSVNDNLLKIAGRMNQRSFEIIGPGGQSISVSGEDPQGIAALNNVLPELLADVVDPETKPHLVKLRHEGEPPAYWDYPDSQISVINVNSIHALEAAFGASLDPRRFRGNLLIDNAPAWAEIGFAGSRYALGDAEIEFIRPARRCPALSVNPDTGDRDIEVHKLLAERFGHGYFGIYAKVVKGGKIRRDDVLELLGPTEAVHSDAFTEGASPYPTWPKLAYIISDDSADDRHFTLTSAGPWPLVDGKGGKSMRIHLGADNVAKAELMSCSQDGRQLSVAIRDVAIGETKTVVVTGPYGR